MISDDDLEKLEEYVCIEGTEIGDYLISLLNVRRYSDPHGMSEQLSKEIDAELLHWLGRFRAETEIEEVTEPRPDSVYKVLNWIYEG